MAVQPAPWSTSGPLSSERETTTNRPKREALEMLPVLLRRNPPRWLLRLTSTASDTSPARPPQGRAVVPPAVWCLPQCSHAGAPSLKSKIPHAKAVLAGQSAHEPAHHRRPGPVTPQTQAGRKPEPARQQQSWLEGSGHPRNYALYWEWARTWASKAGARVQCTQTQEKDFPCEVCARPRLGSPGLHVRPGRYCDITCQVTFS